MKFFGAVPLVFLCWAAAAAELPSVPASTAPWRTETNGAFGVGESLLFAIKYGFVSAGSATMEVRSTETVHDRMVYHIVSAARTNSTIDVFFKVRDLNETWMDSEGLFSHRFRQAIHEGRYIRDVESRFDPVAGTFAFWRRGKNSEETRNGTIPPFVQDILTSLYYVRTRTLVPGQDIVGDVNSGAKTWSLRIKVKGMEKISVPAGKFECYRVEPLISGDGLFLQNGNLEVWMPADSRHMPVLMRSKVMVGSFTAELKAYDFERTTPRISVGD